MLEIGVEELPAGDLDSAIAQLKVIRSQVAGEELHLEHGTIHISGTPRRLAVYVEALAARQPDREDLVKGPAADRAFGPDGVPTPAAIGFAKGKGLTPKDLEVRDTEGGKYVFALVKQAGRPAGEVLVESLPGLVAGIKFDKSMRWNASGVAVFAPAALVRGAAGGNGHPVRVCRADGRAHHTRPAPVQLALKSSSQPRMNISRSSRRTASCWKWKSARR